MEQLVYIAFVVGIAALLVAYAYQAKKNRKRQFHSRQPYDFNEWRTANPSVSSESLYRSINAIADGVGVDAQYLRPEDLFEGSLALKGQFMIDDDTMDDVAEVVEEQLGISWDQNWKSVGDAVAEIALQLDARRH